MVWRLWPHTQVYWVSTTQKRCYHGTILTEVSSPNLHGRLNVQPMALERAQPSQHTMCRAVNERARLLLQFDGPLGLPKWPHRRALSTPSHLSRNKGQGGDAWFDGAEWAVFTI